MGRFSPTVQPTSVNPWAVGLSSLGDAFFRAFAMRHQQRMAQDAQDAQLAEQGIYRGTAPTGPLTVTPNVGAVPNMPAVSNAADRAALGQTLPGGRTATLGIPIGGPAMATDGHVRASAGTTPAQLAAASGAMPNPPKALGTPAPSSFTVAGPDGRGLVDTSRYQQINPRLYVDQTETPAARARAMADYENSLALGREQAMERMREGAALERTRAQLSGYGTIDDAGNFIPGVRTRSTMTTQDNGAGNTATNQAAHDARAAANAATLEDQRTADRITVKRVPGTRASATPADPTRQQTAQNFTVTRQQIGQTQQQLNQLERTLPKPLPSTDGAMRFITPADSATYANAQPQIQALRSQLGSLTARRDSLADVLMQAKGYRPGAGAGTAAPPPPAPAPTSGPLPRPAAPAPSADAFNAEAAQYKAAQQKIQALPVSDAEKQRRLQALSARYNMRLTTLVRGSR